jgi:hypothetical protein
LPAPCGHEAGVTRCARILRRIASRRRPARSETNKPAAELAEYYGKPRGIGAGLRTNKGPRFGTGMAAHGPVPPLAE